MNPLIVSGRFLQAKRCSKGQMTLDDVNGWKQIVGLVYKVGKNDFDVVNGKHVFRGIPNSPFIISPNDRDCEF